MRLADIVEGDLIIEELKADRRSDALRKMMARLGAQRGWTPEQLNEYLWDLLWRNAVIPGGLGRGVAFPNARIAGLAHPILVVALSKSGLDFRAPDRRPAHVILLYLGRDNPPDDEREMLSGLSSALGTERVAATLNSASTSKEVWEAILTIDADFLAGREQKENEQHGVHGSTGCSHPRG